MKKEYFYLIIVFLCSCSKGEHKQDKLSEAVHLDQKRNSLNIQNVKDQNIRLIELTQENNNRQTVILDSNNRIIEIQNIIAIEGNSRYVNTWIGFDSQNNFDFSKSYYYETSLIYEEGGVFIECYLPNLLNDNPNCYVLLNKYDQKFRTSGMPSDTLWFDKDFLVRIPVKKYQTGKNNFKFIIAEDKLIGTRHRVKYTYVNKDFIVAKRK